jgi:dTDP-4-amino-4,6-dideoxygalactose transaminase
VRIPFNRPSFQGEEHRLIDEAVRSGHASGDGPMTGRCREILEAELGCARVLLTPSGTAALELAAMLLGVGPGDEVVVPSFTFVSTANAFVLAGARPVFADVDPETLNLDPASAEARVGPRTRALVPVHYAGVGCDMDALGALARGRGLAVVEDNAHGAFGRYRDRPLGALGDLGALSFHETKNLSCGEGGALLVNRADLVARAEVLREKGTDRSAFHRGEVDRYRWLDRGTSGLLSDLLAAVLLAQLRARDRILGARRALWERYRECLADWAAREGVRLPAIPEGRTPSYHMFHLLFPSGASRDAALARLRERGIGAVFHYLPLHLSPMGRSLGGREGDCPVAEDAAARVLRLPFFTDMTEAEQDQVLEEVRTIRA